MEIVNQSASRIHETFNQIIFKYEWALKIIRDYIQTLKRKKKKTLERYYSWRFTYFLLWEVKLGYTVLDNNQVRRLVRYERIRLGTNNLVYLICMRSVRTNRGEENPTGILDKQSHRELSNQWRCPAKRHHAEEHRDAQQLLWPRWHCRDRATPSLWPCFLPGT